MNINYLALLIALFFLNGLDAQPPQLVVQRGHIAPVTDVVVSNKYNFIITASYDKSIKVWHKTTGLEIRSIDNFMKGFSEIKMDISNDGRYIFATAANGSIEKIDLEDGSQEVIQEPNGVFITDIILRPQSSQIAIGYENGNVELLDYTTKTTIKNWKLSMQFIKKIQFSQNGKLIFANSNDNKFLAYNIKKEKELTSFPEAASAFAVSPKGKEIAIAQPNKTFSIHKTKNGKLVENGVLNHPTQFVGYADNDAIIVMNKKFQISQLNAKNFKLSPIPLQLPRFFVFKTLGDGNFVFNDGPVTKIFDLNNLTTPKEYKGYDGNVYASSVNAALFDKEIRNIVTGGGEQTLQFWGEVNNEQLPIGFEITKIKSNAKGTEVVVAGNSNDFHLIDMGLLEIEKTFTGHTKEILDIGFVGDNIVSVGKDKTIKIWSKDGTIVYDWTDHKGYIYSLSTFKNMVVTGDSKGQIYLWDVLTGQQLDQLQRPGHIIQQLEFDDEGSIVYIGFDDGKVWAWDWELEEVDWTFQPYTTPVSVLEFYDNRLYVASGIADSKLGASISIYNVIKQKLDDVLEGHLSGINDLQISSNGHYLVSAANDNLVKLWHIKSKKLLATRLIEIKN
jgi:WD40 repeat protein